MGGIPVPTPPEAYWAAIPWWGYLGFLVVALLVVVVIGPWVVQRSRGAGSAMQSREQALANREAVVDGYREDQIKALRMEIADLKGELKAATIDARRGWDFLRGWLQRTHDVWHELNNLRQRFNSAIELAGSRASKSEQAAASFCHMFADQPLIPPPPRLPDIDRIEPKGPGETKYA